ncbi:hypothetical protein L3X38_042754 [Prunus dulcis]|uniref:Uncharacterized protein n=1 Tax=Prunus dulcis TaxID=3755 RepID=A0AAD4UVS2_PRUDU|nr:hypothetical protein L3X38_042754 [Prunus dulcis]
MRRKKKEERIAKERYEKEAVQVETTEKIEQKIEKPAKNLEIERTDGKANQKDDNTIEEKKKESELEMQESPNDEDENTDEKTLEKSVIMQAKEVGTQQLRSSIKIIKDRKDRKPAKKPDYTYPEAHKKARKRVDTGNIFFCQLKECAATSLKTKLVQIPDAKKLRGLNEALAKMIAKILASIKLTPEYAQTLKYLIRHGTTNFKLTENRECPQQTNNS